MQSTRVDDLLKQWQQELLDLTKGNRLLYFKSTSSVLTFEHPVAGLLFDGLVNRGRSYTFYRPSEEEQDGTVSADEQLMLLLVDEGLDGDESDAAEEVDRPQRPPRLDEVVVSGDPKKVEAALYRLRLKARSALLEQGVNVLFATFGMLDWAETAAGDARVLSPLFLVPVHLDRETALDPYTLAPINDEVIVNPALARKLQTDFRLQLNLPDGPEDDVSLDQALDHIRGIVRGQRDWTVRSETHLGLFSFVKYAMYADLEANRERFRAHPVVRAISGEEEGLPEPAGYLPSAAEMDEWVIPVETYQVLDADASQQEAIAAVKAGTNLVIQGPPGTGKSQTITNIIAESLAAGKTVLFVSEKATARDVVAKRLTEAGLGEFCLNARQDDKTAIVVKDLTDTFRSTSRVRNVNTDLDLERIALLRRDLNAYAHALHDANNLLGLSAFQVHGEIVRREMMPTIIFGIADIGALTQQRLAGFSALVQRLRLIGDALLDAEDHPWQGCTIPAFTPQVQANLRDALGRLGVAADDLWAVQARLRRAVGMPPEASLRSAEWLRDLLAILDDQTIVQAQWLLSPSLAPLLQTAYAHRRQADDYRRRLSSVLERYEEGVLTLDLPGVRQRLVNGGAPQAQRIRGQGPYADRALAQRQALQSAGRRVSAAFNTLVSAGAEVATRLGFSAPATLSQARSIQSSAALVLQDPRPQPDWFEPGRQVALQELAGEASRQQEIVIAGKLQLQARFEDDLFEVDTAELLQRFEDNYASWTRSFRPAFHRDIKRLRRLQKEDVALTYGDAFEALKQARRVALAQNWIEGRRNALVAGFGHYYAGLHTDWNVVNQALKTIKDIINLFGNRPIPAPLIHLLLGQAGGTEGLKPFVSALDRAIGEADAAWVALGGLISVENLPFQPAQFTEVPLVDLDAWVRSWLEGLEPLWGAADLLMGQRRMGGVPVPVMLAEIDEMLAVRAMRAGLASVAEDLRAAFGGLFDGWNTDWEVILQSLEWTGRLLAHFGGTPPRPFVEVLLGGLPDVQQDRERLLYGISETGQLVEYLRPMFDPSAYRIGAAPPEQAPLAELAAWARTKRGALFRLEEWIDYQRALADAQAVGLASFVQRLVQARPARDTWHDAFLRQVYSLWLTWRYDQEPALARFRGEAHAETIKQFQHLDRWQ